MTQEQWLTDYIAKAFDGVQLGDGIDIHAAESMDDYGNPDEDRLSQDAERHDWSLVPSVILSARPTAITFLDAPGFRFYTPAIMTTILNQNDETGLLLDAFLWNLKVTIHGKVKEVNFHDLFTDQQRAAIIRFLKYLVHQCGGDHEDADAKQRLDEIQNRTG